MDSTHANHQSAYVDNGFSWCKMWIQRVGMMDMAGAKMDIGDANDGQ